MEVYFVQYTFPSTYSDDPVDNSKHHNRSNDGPGSSCDSSDTPLIINQAITGCTAATFALLINILGSSENDPRITHRGHKNT